MRDAKTVNVDYFWTETVLERDFASEPTGDDAAVHNPVQASSARPRPLFRRAN